MAFLLRKNPEAQFWTTYQERRFGPAHCSRRRPAPASDPPSPLSADWSVEALLRRWNLRCVDVRLDSFGADTPDLAGSSLPGRHHVLMAVITLGGDEGGGP